MNQGCGASLNPLSLVEQWGPKLRKPRHNCAELIGGSAPSRCQGRALQRKPCLGEAGEGGHRPY